MTDASDLMDGAGGCSWSGDDCSLLRERQGRFSIIAVAGLRTPLIARAAAEEPSANAHSSTQFNVQFFRKMMAQYSAKDRENATAAISSMSPSSRCSSVVPQISNPHALPMPPNAPPMQTKSQNVSHATPENAMRRHAVDAISAAAVILQRGPNRGRYLVFAISISAPAANASAIPAAIHAYSMLLCKGEAETSVHPNKAQYSQARKRENPRISRRQRLMLAAMDNVCAPSA